LDADGGHCEAKEESTEDVPLMQEVQPVASEAQWPTFSRAVTSEIVSADHSLLQGASVVLPWMCATLKLNKCRGLGMSRVMCVHIATVWVCRFAEMAYLESAVNFGVHGNFGGRFACCHQLLAEGVGAQQ